MTFAEWKATRREVPNLDAHFGDGDGTTCSEGPGYVYAGECYITQLMDGEVENGFHLHVGTEEWTFEDLGEAEAKLWEVWAEGEVA